MLEILHDLNINHRILLCEGWHIRTLNFCRQQKEQFKLAITTFLVYLVARQISLFSAPECFKLFPVIIVQVFSKIYQICMMPGA